MAVYYTNVQHKVMGRLLRPRQIRAWIRGQPRLQTRVETLDREDWQRAYGLKDFLPRPTSVLTVSIPDLLLFTALNSFVVGLGVYLGLIWQDHLDTNANVSDSKHAFIAYIISVSVCYITLAFILQSYQGSEHLERILLANMATYTKELAELTIRQQDAEDLKGRPMHRRPTHREETKQQLNSSPADHLGATHENALVVAARNETSSTNGTSRMSCNTTDEAHPAVAPSQPCHLKVTRSPAATTATQPATEVRAGKAEDRLLVDLLHDSARLRRELAKVEERLARCYEQHLNTQKDARATT